MEKRIHLNVEHRRVEDDRWQSFNCDARIRTKAHGFRVVQETFFATLHTFYRFAHFGSSHNKMHVRADFRDGIQSDWKLWNDLDTLDKNKIGVKIKCAT